MIHDQIIITSRNEMSVGNPFRDYYYLIKGHIMDQLEAIKLLDHAEHALKKLPKNKKNTWTPIHKRIK